MTTAVVTATGLLAEPCDPCEDPVLGRFISADTIVPNAGNGQDYNRYSYVRNNPLRYNDPSGHCPANVRHTKGCAEAYDPTFDLSNVEQEAWRPDVKSVELNQKAEREMVYGVLVGFVEELVVEYEDGEVVSIESAAVTFVGGGASNYVTWGDGRIRFYTEGPWAGQVRYLPLRKGSNHRAIRQALLGSKGSVASGRVSLARAGGKALTVAGVVITFSESFEIYAGEEHQIGRSIGRTALISGSGAAGGAAAGSLCGPGAPICSLSAGAVGALVGGIAGEWVWENADENWMPIISLPRVPG